VTGVARQPASVERIPFARTVITSAAQEAAARVLASGWVTSGPEVAEFEREFAVFVGADHAVAVGSCTVAIELALRALRLPMGARVLTPTLTFCGAVQAVIHAGLQPVLVDCDPDTLLPSESSTAAAVAEAGGVEAMVVLHYAGMPAPVLALGAAAGLPIGRVVEDAAHALGTRVGERRVATGSAAACFSFYATKNLPIGEGGMLTTDDGEIAAFVRYVRLHGISHDAWDRHQPGNGWRYEVNELGIKANMTDVQAAIGRVHLRSLEAWQRRRAELFRCSGPETDQDAEMHRTPTLTPQQEPLVDAAIEAANAVGQDARSLLSRQLCDPRHAAGCSLERKAKTRDHDDGERPNRERTQDDLTRRPPLPPPPPEAKEHAGRQHAEKRPVRAGDVDPGQKPQDDGRSNTVTLRPRGGQRDEA
jgi:dTDP-4-amino-4,6-dideoxygalactose transaminase